jgi:hypothetical protein
MSADPSTSQQPPGAAADEQAPEPWFETLQQATTDILHHTRLLQEFRQLRATGLVPRCFLTALLPQSGPGPAPGFALEWSYGLQKLEAAQLLAQQCRELAADLPEAAELQAQLASLTQVLGTPATLLWNPLEFSIRSRLAQLTLDVSQLQQFVHDPHAAGASYAS